VFQLDVATPSKLKASLEEDVVPAFGNIFVDVAVSFSALAESITNVNIKNVYNHFIFSFSFLGQIFCS
jgi:hypothetical protein